MKKISRKIVYYAGTIFCMLVFLIPLWMVFVNSLKDKKGASRFDISLPEVWQFENYVQVFQEANVGRAFINGLVISVGSVAIILIVTSMVL